MVINKCPFCIYVTDVKCNLRRHINAKHTIKNDKNKKVEKNGENVTPVGENVTPGGENVTPGGENVTPGGENVTPGGENVTPGFFCKKCNKKYNSKRYLTNHELKCRGLDELTCSRCMLSFSNRHHNHVI